MDELRKQVMEKAGITEEQATAAIDTVSTFIKQRVPNIIHQQLDKIIAGQSLEESIKNQVEELGTEVRERTEGFAKELKSAIEGAFRSKKDST